MLKINKLGQEQFLFVECPHGDSVAVPIASIVSIQFLADGSSKIVLINDSSLSANSTATTQLKQLFQD